MKNIIIPVLIGIGLFFNLEVRAQLSEEVDKKTPELPGVITLDFGFNLLTGKPSHWNDVSWIRSRSVSIYFIKPFELTKTIEFRPGIGVNIEKIGSKNGEFIATDLTTSFDPLYEDGVDVLHAHTGINHIEVPVEFRYNFTGNSTKGSPYIGLGGMVGYVFETKLKAKYSPAVSGEKYKLKSKGDADFLEAPKVRAGIQARIGLGSVNLFYKYYLTPLFKESGLGGNGDTQLQTIGISISGF